MRGEQDEIKARFGRSYINAFEVKVAELIDSGARPEVPDEGAPTDELNAPGLNDPAREPGFIIQPGLRPVTVNITRTDTLHHFFARHVYSLFDPLARIIRNRAADNWFFYGTMYTYAMLLFGLRMFMKYRHNRYQILRTISVMFFQLGFAYLIPHFLVLFQQKEFYFSYFWPLKPEYLYPSIWLDYLGRQFEFAGAIEKTGFYFVLFALFMTVIATPLLTFLYGKRWYCSWVCGCGGLAETLGDPFRH
ncbi:MAG: 4Fe-4S binding protein, partial [Leptospiraceae bacterium]|nr:4Fe-4S binding protein [Leptospiraceae bacterium]